MTKETGPQKEAHEEEEEEEKERGIYLLRPFSVTVIYYHHENRFLALEQIIHPPSLSIYLFLSRAFILF